MAITRLRFQLHRSGDDKVYCAAIFLLHDEEFRRRGIRSGPQQFRESGSEGPREPLSQMPTAARASRMRR